MKKYRPSTKQVMVGIIFMLAGVICWCIKAPMKDDPHTLFLFPVGLLLICIGGLELTITAFITLYKNDKAMRQKIKEKTKDKHEYKG
ncbi:hypothetical protein GCM10022297_08900 [Lactobacillus hamsteri]|uniref:Uncharacterized protein n=1 Tax=Lactobacillus hamsteri DSM 5661 = JCM 6256 TaxID=1423754 RepID=A0A0R1YMJ5_9LACO|nr:hypothetical protein [Lactobacillus hamsteri]KRM41179.1 hypothetical protein FC39_GL001381 [Lactobacillus hamsteri DSM 5661 = JCM 6256]